MIAATYSALSAASGPPTRGFSIPSSSLSSPAAVQRAVTAAMAGGYDAIVAPLALGSLNEAVAFDGTAELLRRARESGLGVHLSIAVSIAAAVGELPPSREHVMYQHPEWLMVPRELAPELLKTDVRSPAYLGRLTRWTRANADRVDGLYVSPLDPAAAAYLADSVAAATTRYAADGVYLDAVDFPGTDFDYSRHAVTIFRTAMRTTMPALERARLDEIEAIDPFAYPEELPEAWRQFRESALTTLLERVRSAVTSANPTLSVTAGARSQAETSLRDHFQNWRIWLIRGVVQRVGFRNRSTGTVLFSSDGAIPADPAQASAAQTSSAGGPR